MYQKTLNGLASSSLLIALGVFIALRVLGRLNPWGWVTAMFAGGLLFYCVYTLAPSRKILLVPSYMLFVLASLSTLLLLDLLKNYLIPSFVLAAIILPLALMFLKSRHKNRGLLVLMYFLSVVSLLVLLSETGMLRGIAIPSFVLFSVAFPFFVLYMHRRTRWWALTLASIPVLIALSLLISKEFARQAFPVIFILAGFLLISRLPKRQTI